MPMHSLNVEHSLKATYIPIRPMVFPVYPKQGNFPLMIDEKPVGTVDVSTFHDETYVSVQLVDTFLNLEQLQTLITQLKTDYHLSSTQKVSFEQI